MRSSSTPKVLICLKSPENPGKVFENLDNILENLGENGTQRCLNRKNGAQPGPD